jgi:hypothetical protein
MKRKEYKRLSVKLYEILTEKYDRGALVINNVSIYAYKAIRTFAEDKTIVRLLSDAIQDENKEELYEMFEKWLKTNKFDYTFYHIRNKYENTILIYQLALVFLCGTILALLF